jgi:hypothetical protein
VPNLTKYSIIDINAGDISSHPSQAESHPAPSIHVSSQPSMCTPSSTRGVLATIVFSSERSLLVVSATPGNNDESVQRGKLSRKREIKE